DASLDRNLPLQLWRGRGALAPRGAEVDRKQRRRHVQGLEPPRVLLGRKMVPLRVVLVGPELGVVVEVPARELARRDAARNRIQPGEQPLGSRAPLGENGM